MAWRGVLSKCPRARHHPLTLPLPSGSLQRAGPAPFHRTRSPPNPWPGRQRRTRCQDAPKLTPMRHDRRGCRCPRKCCTAKPCGHAPKTHAVSMPGGIFSPLICSAIFFKRSRFQEAQQESPASRLTPAGCVTAPLLGSHTPTSTERGMLPGLPGTGPRSRRLRGPNGNQTQLQSQPQDEACRQQTPAPLQPRSGLTGHFSGRRWNRCLCSWQTSSVRPLGNPHAPLGGLDVGCK